MPKATNINLPTGNEILSAAFDFADVQLKEGAPARMAKSFCTGATWAINYILSSKPKPKELTRDN